MDKFLNVDHIAVNYQSRLNETRAIEDVSFDINEGEFVSIIGPSGCGKSTLLSAICGLVPLSEGTVLLDGEPLIKNRAKVGYMLQKDYLFEWRSIAANVTLGLELQNKLNPETEAFAMELLDKYGLGDFKKSKPSELSGGMRQRAALIRTLATRPEILLLDEPFSALDYQTRLYVADEIGTIIRKEKKTVLLVTHDISEAISLSDRVIVLSRRPSVIKSIITISLSIPERTAMKSREAPEFKDYFNRIWKELDVHVC